MKIAVLTSGGVDSSVALYLLKKQGYDVTSYYIKIWLEEDFKVCPWKEDLKYARAVTNKLKVLLKVVNLQKEYWKSIVEYTLKTLKEGRTPNPDIMCNQLIKFGVFDEKYGKKYDRIATGHYARLKNSEPDFAEASSGKQQVVDRLFRAKDAWKDQTYFLSRMTKKQLIKAMFPIGDMLKSEVRDIAKKAGLPTHARPDSQGLCFLGRIRFNDFLERYMGKKKGGIIDIESGRVVGEHDGYWFFTIGQRSGLGIGGAGKPYYVAKKDVEKNIVYVAKGSSSKYLLAGTVVLKSLNVLAGDLLEEGKEYLVKLRHPHKGVMGKVKKLNDNSLELELKDKAFGVTEGQFGMLYDGEVVVCSGEIGRGDV
ncbi:MAG: tRNA 2-thiouridine(34) synthase MnmA [Patescibacteria group bacterium]|nr:tRNA 2-thiouridine(34) synthase MnmA [Patescibacteria group bacterium]